MCQTHTAGRVLKFCSKFQLHNESMSIQWQKPEWAACNGPLKAWREDKSGEGEKAGSLAAAKRL